LVRLGVEPSNQPLNFCAVCANRVDDGLTDGGVHPNRPSHFKLALAGGSKRKAGVGRGGDDEQRLTGGFRERRPIAALVRARPGTGAASGITASAASGAVHGRSSSIALDGRGEVERAC
jgi:hypothetical protein